MGQGDRQKNLEQGQEGTLQWAASVCARVKMVTTIFDRKSCLSVFLSITVSASWTGRVWALNAFIVFPAMLPERKKGTEDKFQIKWWRYM